jgi:hypothetical protein
MLCLAQAFVRPFAGKAFFAGRMIRAKAPGNTEDSKKIEFKHHVRLAEKE